MENHVFVFTASTGWNMAYPASGQENAVRALLGLVQQCATWAAHTDENPVGIALEYSCPEILGAVPVRYCATLDEDAGPCAQWVVFVQGGLLADGAPEQTYPDPVSAVLALGAQCMALVQQA